VDPDRSVSVLVSTFPAAVLVPPLRLGVLGVLGAVVYILIFYCTASLESPHVHVDMPVKK
jgi:hypothetical protein